MYKAIKTSILPNIVKRIMIDRQKIIKIVKYIDRVCSLILTFCVNDAIVSFKFSAVAVDKIL